MRFFSLFGRKTAVTTAVMLIIILICMGCKSESNEGNGSAETDISSVTTGFLEDTVFTVSDVRVSLTEWYLYALWQVAEAESMYGEDIWDYVVDSAGTTMAEALKTDIMEQIVYIKIVCAQAERLGISITEDDQIDINIQTEDFMNKLSTEQIAEYNITSDAVKSILSDNILAMKVYENLTLNIDTSIPDDEVRHMVLEYVMILKDYENEDGEFVRYTESELAGIRADAEEYLQNAINNSEITHLAEINDDRYSVTELVADYATLVEKLPGNLPGIAFSLRQDEINGLYETDDAYFIFDCVSRTDEESTNQARVKIIEARQKALFEEKYSEWEAAAVVKTNYKVWDELKLK